MRLYKSSTQDAVELSKFKTHYNPPHPPPTFFSETVQIQYSQEVVFWIYFFSLNSPLVFSYFLYILARLADRLQAGLKRAGVV